MRAVYRNIVTSLALRLMAVLSLNLLTEEITMTTTIAMTDQSNR